MEQKIHFVKTLVKNDKNSDSEYVSMIQEYDKNGNIILTQEYDDENNLTFENKQEYNENNKLISENTISYIDGYKEDKTFIYDADGYLINERIEFDGGWVSHKKYEFDSDKKSLKITSLDEEDEVEEIILIEYNENKAIVCQKEYDEYEKLKLMIKNEYNEYGELSLKEEYDNKEKLDKSIYYYYNDNNKLFGIETLNKKGKVLDWVKLEYDENNNITQQLMMSGYRIEIKYNNETNSIVESRINSNGDLEGETTIIKNKEGNVLEEHSLEKVIKYLYEYF